MTAFTPSLDLPALLASCLAAGTCAALGSFLLLRKAAMLGDAISHAVLPGLVIGFLITDSRSPLPMMLGAVAAAALATGAIEIVRRRTRVEPGAAMGVVFSAMFALGVILIRAYADNVDLDPDCVLFGALEGIRWDALSDWSRLADPAVWSQLPRQVVTLAVVTVLVAAFIALFFKHLRLYCFDAALGASMGFPPIAMGAALTVLTAAATVASFEAVGSILVVAMLVCPGAAARQLTDRLSSHVLLSVALGVLSAALGYTLAAWAPGWLGLERDVSAAGMMAVAAGFILVLAIVFSPSRGVIARQVRAAHLRADIAREDVLGDLYRRAERHAEAPDSRSRAWRNALARAVRVGEVAIENGVPRLTPAGEHHAREVIRTHRLWETYLVHEAGQKPDHVHRPAHQLEHLTTTEGRLVPPREPGGDVDPQGRPIPE